MFSHSVRAMTDTVPGTAGSDRPDGAERILHAALDLFGQQGVSATSLKAIAASAGVSQALIIHHYGSKDSLRTACDVHVAELLRETKIEQIAQGSQLNPVLALAAVEE